MPRGGLPAVELPAVVKVVLDGEAAEAAGHSPPAFRQSSHGGSLNVRLEQTP